MPNNSTVNLAPKIARPGCRAVVANNEAAQRQVLELNRRLDIIYYHAKSAREECQEVAFVTMLLNGEI